LSTLTTALKDKGLLDSVGGISYLSSLVNNIPPAANVGKYAEIVKNSAGLRKLIRAAEKIINDSKVTNANIYEVLDKAEQSIFEIRSVYDSRHC
jgi:replicative DNA helicase